MEHLPAVLNPNEPVNVPWHGGSFDNGDFEGFASRRRIDLASLQQGQLGDLPKQEAAAFLQAWLYFGLLQQTLQLPVLTDDYVNTTVSGGKLITTGRLREHLRRWKTIYEAEGEKPEQLEMRRLRIVETLDLSYGVWYGFEPGIFADIAGIEVELSIRLLAAAIEHAVLSVSRYSKEITWEPWIQVYETPWRRNLNCNFLRERLKRHGWCPSMFSDTKFRLPMQYFVSLFGPPKRMFHKECTETDKACREVKVVLSEYKTQHVNDDCSCRFLNPPMETVNGIIDDGGIPILYLAQGSDGTEIKVVRQRPELVFTAISHV